MILHTHTGDINGVVTLCHHILSSEPISHQHKKGGVGEGRKKCSFPSLLDSELHIKDFRPVEIGQSASRAGVRALFLALNATLFNC